MPAKDYVIVRWINDQSIDFQRTLYVTNILGQLVMKELMSGGQDTQLLDISHLETGVYIVTSTAVDLEISSVILIKE